MKIKIDYDEFYRLVEAAFLDGLEHPEYKEFNPPFLSSKIRPEIMKYIEKGFADRGDELNKPIYLVFTADKSVEPYDVDYEGYVFHSAYDSEEKATGAAEELETEQIEVNIIDEFLK